MNAYAAPVDNGDGTASDAVSGLMWEIKSSSDGNQNFSTPNDADNQYTWYDSTDTVNVGTAGDGTDTEDFITALNAASYAGYANWRMPTEAELETLKASNFSNPCINTTIFDNLGTEGGHSDYWTSDSHSYDGAYAVYIEFMQCNIPVGYKSEKRFVRAVR